jgi:hypothetical protein
MYDGQMSAPSPLLLAQTVSYCSREKLLLSKNARPSSGAILIISFSGGFTIEALALAAVRPVFEPIFLIKNWHLFSCQALTLCSS